MSTFKTTRAGKDIEIDTKEAFIKIRNELKRNNYEREGDGLSDAIINQMATFGMIIDGVLWNHEVSNIDLPDDMVSALQLNWYALEALIKEREEEHSKLWDIAFAKDQE